MRTLYAPVFFLGFIGSAVWLLDEGASLGWLPVLLLLAIGVSLLCERLSRGRREIAMPMAAETSRTESTFAERNGARKLSGITDWMYSR